MRRVIVESPFAGDVRRNTAYAVACLRDCIARGEAPFASHLIYPLVLDDLKPGERAVGIELGLCWGECAEATVVYTDFGITPGMDQGIVAAQMAGRPIEFRQLQALWQELRA